MIYHMPPVPAEPTQLDRIESNLAAIIERLNLLVEAIAAFDDEHEPNDGTRDQTQPL